MIKITTPEESEVYRKYDIMDHLVKETIVHKNSGIHKVTEYGYDKAGNLIRETDGNGHAIRREYDFMNRLLKETDKEGGVTRYFYNLNGERIKAVDADNYEESTDNGAGYTFCYDELGRLVEVRDPLGNVKEQNQYDIRGNLTECRDAYGLLFKNNYDLGGRKTAIYTAHSAADKPAQRYEYDSAGNIIGITDGEQNYTKFELDAWGRITGIYKPDGSKESYTYDYAGNTTTTTDGNGGEIQYAFNTFNKLSSITDQAGESDSFTYDKEGNLATHTDRNGRTIQYTYGISGMLLKKSGEDGSYHTYKYNENGQLVQSESAGVQYRYDYTPSGRVKTKYINNRPALSYEYTRGGKVSSITDISGKKTTYSYDAAGRMTSVKENETILATYQYMDNDLLKEVTFANGISTKYEYDREQNLAHLITTGRNGEILLSYSYQYDNNANRIQKAVIGTTSMYGLDNKAEPKATHYKYDCLQRISSVSYPEGKTESFVYDFAGNRIQKNSENITETYQYDIRNRLICKHKKEDSRTYQTTYKYDQQGSLLSEVGSYQRGINSNANPLQSTDNQAVIDYTKKYTYNDFHQNVQTEVIKGTEQSIQENIYDGEGLRYAVIENGSRTSFVTNGWSNFTELDENHHVKKRIIRGIEIVASEDGASYHYYHGNEREDIEYITDVAGKAVNSYEYDAFGRITKAEELLQNRYTYNGEAYDQVTEQYYLRARYYNPTIARFTQEDVYRGDGLNLYAFCRNNAVMYVDPSGYSTWDLFRSKNKGQYTRKELSDAYENSGLKSNRTTSKRQEYLGSTPNKNSEVGEAVIRNMEKWGQSPIDFIIRDSFGKALMYKSLTDGCWYDISTADMCHKNATFEAQLKNVTGKIESGHLDAVEYWNTKGKYTGAQSDAVRKYMTDPDNYYLEHKSYNRSDGANLKNEDGTRMTYDEPVDNSMKCKK